MQIQLILQLLNALISFVPQGTALWEKLQGNRTLVDQIIAENRKPTADEIAALRLDSTHLEDALSARAAQAASGEG